MYLLIHSKSSRIIESDDMFSNFIDPTSLKHEQNKSVESNDFCVLLNRVSPNHDGEEQTETVAESKKRGGKISVLDGGDGDDNDPNGNNDDGNDKDSENESEMNENTAETPPDSDVNENSLSSADSDDDDDYLDMMN